MKLEGVVIAVCDDANRGGMYTAADSDLFNSCSGLFLECGNSIRLWYSYGGGGAVACWDVSWSGGK